MVDGGGGEGGNQERVKLKLQIIPYEIITTFLDSCRRNTDLTMEATKNKQSRFK